MIYTARCDKCQCTTGLRVVSVAPMALDGAAAKPVLTLLCAEHRRLRHAVRLQDTMDVRQLVLLDGHLVEGPPWIGP